MKRFAVFSICMLILLSGLCACQKDGGEDLAFVEKTESGNSQEDGSSGKTEAEKPVSFSKDWNQGNSYNFWAGPGMAYYAANNGNIITLYAADPLSMTYRPLCRKEGCLHNDEGCFATLFKEENGLHNTGKVQPYDDGLYEQLVRETDDDSAVLEYYRIDPDGKKPKQKVWDIPLDDLYFAAENYHVYPTALLHRGNCIIESTKHEEGDPADLQEELGEENGDGQGYTPANPYNQIAATRSNETIYVSVYDLEKKTMQKVLEKTYESISWTAATLIPLGDDLYIITRPTCYRPAAITSEDGHKDYDLMAESPVWDIYRWHFGSEAPAERIYSGELCTDCGGMWLQEGQLMYLDLRGRTYEGGSRGAFVLCSLDLSSGKNSDIAVLYEESETRNGQADAYFMNGMVIGRKFDKDRTEINYSENVPETISVFNLNGEKELDLPFSEELPPIYPGFYGGAGITGTDGQVLYCSSSNSEQILFYMIPLNGDPVQYFTPADDTGLDTVSLPESAEAEGTEPRVYDDEEFPEMDPTTYGFQTAFAQDDDCIYFPYAFGAYGNEYILCKAEKQTGKRKVLCNIPDCPHNSSACEAYAGSYFYPHAMTVTNRRLYAALDTMDAMGSGIAIRAYDLDTEEWSEIASLNLQDAGIRKNGYSMQNWFAFFHRDCFYYYVVRSKQSGGFPDMKTSELTALIYELPLKDPSRGRLILNEEYPADDFNNVFLRAVGSGDRILYTAYATRNRYESSETESGETEYLSYLENSLLEIGACDLSSGNHEVLYEVKEARSADSLYPDGDTLYYTAWIPKNAPGEPQGGNDLSLFRLDLKTGTDECIAEKIEEPPESFILPSEDKSSDSEQEIFLSVYFCRDGYTVIRQPTAVGETNIDRLYCAFYNFNGEKIREFDYALPDSLKADREKYGGYPVARYLGADLWNLYFCDTYANETESLCIVYAIPVAGDAPVVFSE